MRDDPVAPTEYWGHAKYWPSDDDVCYHRFTPLFGDKSRDKWFYEHAEYALEVKVFMGDGIVLHHTPADAENNRRKREMKLKAIE